MVRYSDELIEEIRNSNDIVDIISQYVVLKRRGRNYFGLCPFHKEKSPSFSVSPDKQIFHCFGCGEGGNVIHFLMKIENVSFVEAVEKLAADSLPEYSEVIAPDALGFEDMHITEFDRTRAYVKVEDGCDSKCSYCIIPYLRGKYRSRGRKGSVEGISRP